MWQPCQRGSGLSPALDLEGWSCSTELLGPNSNPNLVVRGLRVWALLPYQESRAVRMWGCCLHGGDPRPVMRFSIP